MILDVYGYRFYANIEKARKNSVQSFAIRVGKPNEGRQCILLLCDKIGSKYNINVQDLIYHESCCSNKLLEKKSGTVLMLKGALKGLLTLNDGYIKDMKLKTISVTDKSYYVDDVHGEIPLPEKYALQGRKTWYEEHFNAIPSSETFMDKRNQYWNACNWNVGDTQLADDPYFANFTEDTVQNMMNQIPLSKDVIANIIEKLQLPLLSGCEWIIPINTIYEFDMESSYIADLELNMHGGDYSRPRQSFNFAYWFRHKYAK